MSQDLILGHVHPDLACAVALSIVEDPRVVATLESVTVHDTALRPVGTVRDWLREDDPLHQATREYLRARLDVSRAAVRRPGQTGWAAASATKLREEANQRARQARERARGLLAERGVLAHARQNGLKLLGAG